MHLTEPEYGPLVGSHCAFNNPDDQTNQIKMNNRFMVKQLEFSNVPIIVKILTYPTKNACRIWQASLVFRNFFSATRDRWFPSSRYTASQGGIWWGSRRW